MDNEKNLVIPIGENEDEFPLSPEEKAVEEKASRRQRYIYARVAADNLAKSIQRTKIFVQAQAIGRVYVGNICQIIASVIRH